MDRAHAERLGGADVGERVVDEQKLVRLAPGALEQNLVDARVGLGDADMPETTRVSNSFKKPCRSSDTANLAVE